jgi:hypothetical protein
VLDPKVLVINTIYDTDFQFSCHFPILFTNIKILFTNTNIYESYVCFKLNRNISDVTIVQLKITKIVSESFEMTRMYYAEHSI